jgi:hypothetical protein
MTHLLRFNGTVQVYSRPGYETISEIEKKLKHALLHATHGDLTTNIPIRLLEVDFSDYDCNLYCLKCLMEIDEKDYYKGNPDYQDLHDFFIVGIPQYEFQLDNLETVHAEFYIGPAIPGKLEELILATIEPVKPNIPVAPVIP